MEEEERDFRVVKWGCGFMNSDFGTNNRVKRDIGRRGVGLEQFSASEIGRRRRENRWRDSMRYDDECRTPKASKTRLVRGGFKGGKKGKTSWAEIPLG